MYSLIDEYGAMTNAAAPEVVEAKAATPDSGQPVAQTQSCRITAQTSAKTAAEPDGNVAVKAGAEQPAGTPHFEETPHQQTCYRRGKMGSSPSCTGTLIRVGVSSAGNAIANERG